VSSSISFQLPQPGIWTVTGEFAGQIVTQRINVTDKGSTVPVSLVFSSATITVTSPVGTSLLLTDGTNQLTATSTGTNVFTIYNMGQWTVSGTLEGYVLNSMTVNVSAGQNYPVQLKIQTATLTVTAPVGTIVTVTGGDDTQEITATNGTAVFQLTALSTYQVSGVLNGLVSNTVSVDVTDYVAYTATLTVEAASIVVTTMDDVSVTAQNGDITLTDIAVNGQVTFQTQTFGEWTIKGTLSGYTFDPQTTNVQAYQQYDVSLNPLAATITVTAPNGTEVVAENSTGEQVQGYVSNGTAVLEIYSFDTWTISGTQNGLVTNSVPVTISDWINYPVTLTIWAATITVTTPTGTLVTAQNGDTQIQASASNDQVVFAVQLTGNWTVSAQFDTQSDSDVVDVQAEQNYPVRLWVPTIVPTVATGSVVTCKQGDTVLTKTSQSGKVKFYVPSLGEWTLNATLNQQSSNTVIVDAQEDRDYPLLLNYTFATITVSTVAGTEVTAQNGAIIITQTADSNGEAVFEVATFGTWTLSASFDGELISTEVEVNEAINYDVELKDPFTTVVYVSNATNMSIARSYCGTASSTQYAILAGGKVDLGSTYSSSVTNTINVYDQSLTRTMPENLQQKKHGFGGCFITPFYVFAGGTTLNASQTGFIKSNTVDIYSQNMTHSVGDALPFYASSSVFVSMDNFYVLYCKGQQEKNFCYYTNGLTAITISPKSNAFSYTYGSKVQNHFVFVNYKTGEASSLNSEMTETPLTPISFARNNLGIANTQNYAMFAGGGSNSSTATNIVDAYKYDLSHLMAPNLGTARYQIDGGEFSNHAIFAAGVPKSEENLDTYNNVLTRESISGFSPARYNCGVASVGNYLLIAGGGQTSSSYSSTVNVFTSV
jgi:hypothetical protein